MYVRIMQHAAPPERIIWRYRHPVALQQRCLALRLYDDSPALQNVWEALLPGQQQPVIGSAVCGVDPRCRSVRPITPDRVHEQGPRAAQRQTSPGGRAAAAPPPCREAPHCWTPAHAAGPSCSSMAVSSRSVLPADRNCLAGNTGSA